MKLVALALALSLTASAQTTFPDPANLRGERVSPSNGHELPIDQGARGLAQLLRKLNTRASLLLIVAHPDDEDGGMLTLTLPRPRSAASPPSPSTAAKAARTSCPPTSKTPSASSAPRSSSPPTATSTSTSSSAPRSTSASPRPRKSPSPKWTHDRVLYDAVRAIRLYRPLVIAAVFIGGVIRRPRPAPGLRRDRPGGLQSRRRSHRLPRP